MFDKDYRDWGAFFWYWNSRNIVFPNAAANHLNLNDPFINYYVNNLSSWEKVAAAQGKPGACIPEVTFYNAPLSVNSCVGGGGAAVSDTGVMYCGLEIVNIIWQKYQYTNDLSFLSTVYPLISEEAQFFLASLTPGSDGNLDILNASAEESFPHVNDDVTDLAGIRTAFPEVISAAKALGRDSALQAQLSTALADLAPYPLDPASQGVVAAGVPAVGTGTAGQYPQMEIAFPDQLVGPHDGVVTDLMQQTFLARALPTSYDWAPDAAQAAQLGMGDTAAVLAEQFAQKYQVFPSGFTSWNSRGTTDQSVGREGDGLEAVALQEMALQTGGGMIDVAPAWPTAQAWSGSFSLQAPGGFLVSSEINQQGVPLYVGINSVMGERLQIRNPWPGEQVDLRTDAGTILVTTAATTISVSTSASTAYVLERVAQPLSSFAYAPITGQVNNGVQAFGLVQLGVGSVPPGPRLSVGSADITVTGSGPGTTSLAVQIHNLGSVSSTSTTLRLQDTTNSIPIRLGADVAVPAIAASSSATVTDTISGLASGVRRITATVNPDLNLVEADYLGGSATATVTNGTSQVTATADSTYSGAFGPANVIDGIASTFWTSGSGALPGWVNLALAQATQVQKVVVDPRPAPTGQSFVITDLTVATSVSGQPFVVQGSVSGNTSTGPLTVSFAQPVSADQIRVTVTGETYNGAPRSYADIGEVHLYDPNGTPIAPATPPTADPATATSDSRGFGDGATNVIDGNESTFWTSGSGSLPSWVNLALAQATPVQKVVVDNRPAAGGAYVITNLTVSTSVSGQPFVVQGSVSGNTSTAPLTVSLSQPVAADQIRVTVTGETYNGAPRSYADIAEVHLYDANSQAIAVPQPTTSDPATATADSTYSGYSPANVIDGNASTFWTSGSGSLPGWVSVALAQGTEVQKVVVDNRPAAGGPAYVITDLTVSTSGAGQPLAVQGSVSGNTSAAPLTVSFAQPVAADQIRVTVTGETYNGASRSYADIGEVIAYGPSGNQITATASPPTKDLATATADSTYSGYPPANVIDGSPSTAWVSGSGALPGWVNLALSQATQVETVVVDNRASLGGPPFVITNLTVSTSVSGQPFVVQGSVSANTSSGQLMVSFAQPVAADQIRVTVTGETYDGAPRSYADVGEVLLFGPSGDAIVVA